MARGHNGKVRAAARGKGAHGEDIKEQAEQTAGRRGHCVFFALFEGLKGLPCRENIQDYRQMLEQIKEAVLGETALLEEVCCNGALLSPTDAADFQEAVKRTQVANGYCCSFSDPLLAAFCAAFRLNLFHDFAGSKTTYKVEGARRNVYLHSTENHMSHVRNRCLPGSAIAGEPAIEPAKDEDLIVQGTVVSERRCKGRTLLQVAHTNGIVTLVASGQCFCKGQQVRIALEGAMHEGKRVRRKKVNGMWNEAALVLDGGT